VKIIFSNYDDMKNPHYGGGGAYEIHEVAKRIKKKGMDVTVLTGKYRRSRNEFVNGVRYERIGVRTLMPKLDQFIFHFFVLINSVKRNCDVWIESFTPPVSTSCIPVFTKKSVIGLVSMLAARDMQRKYKMPFIIIERLGLKLYSRFIVHTEESKREINKANSKAIVDIIPTGIDIPEQKQVKKKEQVVFIGRLEVNQKGLDLLVKAIGRLRHDNFRLIIAGGGSRCQLRKLKSLIAADHLEKKIVLVGRVSGVEKRKLFRQSRIIVIPSRYETSPVVALEALSYELPIVCFDIRGMRWLANNACIKAKPFDDNELAKAIRFLRLNDDKAKEISLFQKEYVRRFSWDNIMQKYYEVFQNAVTSK
jgi:phosphatidylinositol alpha-mannosyltransferase